MSIWKILLGSDVVGDDDDLTSSPPYKCGDSSPRRNLRTGERSLNGVDASLIVACSSSLTQSPRPF